jgi:arylsulfatase A-like enzyme
LAGPDKPNIVLILADDMGIDSVGACNPANKIPTPNLDKLVAEGMHFTDAHSGSAVCSPTRYGVLTGRYSWRSRLKSGIVKQWERPLIEAERLTLPGMLREQGYATACIGKWHLGWLWPKQGGGYTEKLNEIDFTQPTAGGPLAVGFDTYFGDDVPNWPPFIWIKDHAMQGVPDTQLTFDAHYHSNKGIGVKGWTFEPVLSTITQKSVDYIHAQSGTDKPFFLYFAMTTPHTPIAPSEAFKGKSGINDYADLLMETDHCVGQVLKALEDKGLSENTLVIFTADNGTSPKCNFDELRQKGTDLQHHYRGNKADAFEGGHRVPFIVRWPGVVPAGSRSDQTISLVDIMRTCAEAAGYDLPDTAGEDSASLMPVLKDPAQEKVLHDSVVMHSGSGHFAIRSGKWKLIFAHGSGGWSDPKESKAKKQGLPPIQLYDLSADPKETENLQASHPEVVQSLTEKLKGIIAQGRSTPGAPQANDQGASWWPGLPWENPAATP